MSCQIFASIRCMINGMHCHNLKKIRWNSYAMNVVGLDAGSEGNVTRQSAVRIWEKTEKTIIVPLPVEMRAIVFPKP